MTGEESPPPDHGTCATWRRVWVSKVVKAPSLATSHATAHQYAAALYRRFGVRSRGQLLAHVPRRAGRAEWVGAPEALDVGRASGSASRARPEAR